MTVSISASFIALKSTPPEPVIELSNVSSKAPGTDIDRNACKKSSFSPNKALSVLASFNFALAKILSCTPEGCLVKLNASLLLFDASS